MADMESFLDVSFRPLRAVLEVSFGPPHIFCIMPPWRPFIKGFHARHFQLHFFIGSQPSRYIFQFQTKKYNTLTRGSIQFFQVHPTKCPTVSLFRRTFYQAHRTKCSTMSNIRCPTVKSSSVFGQQGSGMYNQNTLQLNTNL